MEKGALITDHVEYRYPQSRFTQKKKFKSQFTLKISSQSGFTWLTPAPPSSPEPCVYIGSAQCVGQNTWLYLQTVLFLCSFLLFDKNGLETRVLQKRRSFYSAKEHTLETRLRVATRVHLTIIYNFFIIAL